MNDYMKITLPEQGIIKKQKIDLQDGVTILYRLNNCGKTSALRLIDQFLDRQSMERLLGSPSVQAAGGLSLYIPTNRVVVSTRLTEIKAFEDIENIIAYKRGSYAEYDLHLKGIRDYLLRSAFVRKFIQKAVDRIFHIRLSGFDVRYSDGIENIINIYVNILWLLTWDVMLEDVGEKELLERIESVPAYILIDEIEMFLHVSVQSNLIEGLTRDFPSCSFVFSTHSPLLLTRYRDSKVFYLENGVFSPIRDDLYFKDLDVIYESYFQVKEFPTQVGEDIRYMGDVLLGEREPDKRLVEEITSRMQAQYPNLYRKYNNLITKAKDRAGL